LGKLKIGNFQTFYEIINTVLKNKAQLDSQAELSDWQGVPTNKISGYSI
jgi:hypothetical protein